jgi:hypothetical protein
VAAHVLMALDTFHAFACCFHSAACWLLTRHTRGKWKNPEARILAPPFYFHCACVQIAKIGSSVDCQLDCER